MSEYPQLIGKYGLGDNITDNYLIEITEEIKNIPTSTEREDTFIKLLETAMYVAISSEDNHYDKYLDLVTEVMNRTAGIKPRFIIKVGFTIENYCERKWREDRTRHTNDEICYGSIISRNILEKI